MSDEGRYSKVSRRMWNDQAFRRLSGPQPNAQTLWVRLLTGPEQTCIPGLFPAWEAGLAQSLGWPLERFRERFRELFQEGLIQADWEAGLVWIPNAIKHNQPANPNMIAHWRDTWVELPECALKAKAYQELKLFLEPLGKPYLQRFEACCLNRMANQEQEQEQEQDLFLSATPVAQTKAPKIKRVETTCPGSDANATELAAWLAHWKLDSSESDFQHFLDHHRAKGSKFKDWGAARRTWKENGKNFGRPTVVALQKQTHFDALADIERRRNL